MFVSCCANELHIDVHPIACFLHAAFEDICNGKLTSNLSQITWSGGILLR